MRKKIKTSDYRTKFLQSAERTLDVLEFLVAKQPIGITELAEVKGIGTSTAYRILATLEKKGYAIQDPETGKYAVGHVIFQLTKTVVAMSEPLKYVRPYLKELCKETGENVAFGVISQGKDRTLILAEEIADKPIIAKPVLFQHFPLYICACGKAYLLALNNKQLEAVLSKIESPKFTPHPADAGFTKYAPSSSDIKRQLKQFRKLEYTISRDELSVGLCEVASGIFDAEDKFAGAIIILGPSFRFTDRNIKHWAKLLLRSTAKLSLEFKARNII